MKVLLIFVPFLLIIGRYEIMGDLNYFKPMSDHCNKTFPVKQDVILAHNLTRLSDILKNDKNAKCFIHCVFHKLNFVDEKGNVKKKELFENANNVWSQIPEDKKEILTMPEMSPKMKDIVISFIDYCENKDSVAQESDPCNRFYNFSLCLIDDVVTPSG